MRLARHFSLLALLASTPLHAQGTTSIISSGTNGDCQCAHEGKTWPCRSALDFSTPIQCNSNLNLQLVCPDDKKELCTYVNRSTCTEPKVISVCYAADEPQ